MLDIVTIKKKNKSKAKLVNFISKAHLAAFTICIYLEIKSRVFLHFYGHSYFRDLQFTTFVAFTMWSYFLN